MEELEKTIEQIEKVLEDIGGISIYDLSLSRNRKEILFYQKRLQEGYSRLFNLRKHLLYLKEEQ